MRYGYAFLLTRLLRGVTSASVQNIAMNGFLLTRLLRGVTPIVRDRSGYWTISTHTPLARRDRGAITTNPNKIDFYSHASCEA